MGEEELDEVEGLKVRRGGEAVNKSSPPLQEGRSASSSSSSSSSSFMGRGLGLKPNLTLTLTLRPEHSPTYPHVLYTFSGPNRRNRPTPTY